MGWRENRSYELHVAKVVPKSPTRHTYIDTLACGAWKFPLKGGGHWICEAMVERVGPPCPQVFNEYLISTTTAPSLQFNPSISHSTLSG